LFVRRADAESVSVIDREFRQPCSAQRSWWTISPAASEIDRGDRPYSRLAPDVVLLGTGAKAQFPAPAVQAEFLKRGVGIETMDNAAAARTFNVLVGEGRNAVAVFLLPQ
jgi:hypothetical protein